MNINQRISALIAKAESTESEHEANAFYAKAEELMVRHAISREELRAEEDGSAPSEIIRVVIRWTGTQRDWKALGLYGTHHVVRAIGLVRASFVNRAGRCGVVLVGRVSDCEHARRIIESMWSQGKNHLTRWRKTSVEYKVAIARDAGRLKNELLDGYLDGFSTGVAAKIEEGKKAAMKDTPGSTLVLASLDEKLEEAMGEVRTLRTRLNINSQAKNDGYGDGYNATIGAEIGRGR